MFRPLPTNTRLPILPFCFLRETIRKEFREDPVGDGGGGSGWEGLQKPLPPPPSPQQFRTLSSVIAEQLQAIERAQEKTLGE